MTTKESTIQNWPRNKAGQVIFKTSHEAILYAQLITRNTQAVYEIKTNRAFVRRELKHRRQMIHVNYSLLMQLACRSAFYRECLEEVDRITHELPEPKEAQSWDMNHQKKKNKDD